MKKILFVITLTMECQPECGGNVCECLSGHCHHRHAGREFRYRAVFKQD